MISLCGVNHTPPRASRTFTSNHIHRMVPPLILSSSRLLSNLASAVFQYVPRSSSHSLSAHARRDIHDPDERPQFIAFAILIPILVLLSGLFAGLTLGYMSLDETQLNVLSISGTP